MNPLNTAVAALTRLGISLWGSRVLSVRGRSSGELRSTPVNPLVHEDVRYLVAPRGQTQWVRNIRVAGEATLRLGNRVESIKVHELDDADKPDVLRAYLARWKWEVNAFFDGVGPDSPDDVLRGVAHRYPVFRFQVVGGE